MEPFLFNIHSQLGCDKPARLFSTEKEEVNPSTLSYPCRETRLSKVVSLRSQRMNIEANALFHFPDGESFCGFELEGQT